MSKRSLGKNLNYATVSSEHKPANISLRKLAVTECTQTKPLEWIEL